MKAPSPKAWGSPLQGLPSVVEDVLVMTQEGLLGARHQEAHDVVVDAGESLHLGLGEVGCRDALEALLVGLLLGHVVAPALGGGVHEDDLPVVHGDEVDAVRPVRPALLQDLDAPVLQVRADCLVRPLVDALSHGCLPSRVGARPLGGPCGADGACGGSGSAREEAKRGCA